MGNKLVLTMMLIAANLLESGYARRALSVPSQPSSGQCQFQKDSPFAPDIPDINFNLRSVVDYTTTSKLTSIYSSRGTTFIFTLSSIPGLLVSGCNAGTVVALQYCYQTQRQAFWKRYTAFHLLSMTRDGFELKVANRLTIKTTPTENICMSTRDSRVQVCCDKIALDVDQQFQVSLREYTYGMVVASRSIQLLAFTDSPVDQDLEQFRSKVDSQLGPLVGDTLTLKPSDTLNEHSILLARFYIEPTGQVPTTAPPAVTTQSTTSKVVRAEPSPPQQTTESHGALITQASPEPSERSPPETTSTRQILQLVASIAAGCGAILAITLVIIFIATTVKRKKEKYHNLKHMKMKTNNAYGLCTSNSVFTQPRPERTMDDDYGYIDPMEVNPPRPPTARPDKAFGMSYVVNLWPKQEVVLSRSPCIIPAYTHHVFGAGEDSLPNTTEENVYDYIQPVEWQSP